MDDLDPIREFMALEESLDLADTYNLRSREEAQRTCAFVHDLWTRQPTSPRTASLASRAAAVCEQIAHANERLFADVRRRISNGGLARDSLRRLLDAYTDYPRGGEGYLHLQYEPLDTLLDGILQVEETLAEPLPQEPDMVHLEFSPGSVILDLMDHVPLTTRDVFYDLGSGLGHVALLVALLSDARVVGVERQPAYCAFARQHMRALSIDSVLFWNTDARSARYTNGTIFYLFTPFLGSILQDVLERLRDQAVQRTIRVCTYGSCTLDVRHKRWLRPVHGDATHSHALAVFESTL